MKEQNPYKHGQGNSEMKSAVALRYEAEKHDAPVVVAKGKGRIADKLIETAKEHNVPIQEDASLVEVLSKLEIDQHIPVELYQLVAEVLSFVYRADHELKNKAGEKVDEHGRTF